MNQYKQIDSIRERFKKEIEHSIIQEELYFKNNNYEQNYESFNTIKENTTELKDLIDSIMYDFNEVLKELVTVERKV